MKTSKKLLAVLLTLCMIFALLPTFALADNTNTFNAADTSPTVSTAADLAAFAAAVNGGNNFSGNTVTLLANLTLSGEWTPIGNANRSGKTASGNTFAGIFDGNGKTISGLTITTGVANAALGLFGAVSGGTVKNLTLAGVSINVAANANTGVVCGLLLNGGTVENCTVSGSVSSSNCGGVVGRMLVSGTINHCTNHAAITGVGTDSNAGGIVCKAYYTELEKEMNITACVNDGVISASYDAGGIVGLGAANITNCTNSGAVTGTTNAGGIVAEQKDYGEISGNTNTADITNGNAGGIVGWIRYMTTENSSYLNREVIAVTGNNNSGTINGGGNLGSGGIVGNIYNAATVTGNTNSAPSITGYAFASGIVGNLQTSSESEFYSNGVFTIQNNITSTPLSSITTTDVNNCIDAVAYDNHGSRGENATGSTSISRNEVRVASIGSTYYPTLAEAVTAAQSGDTIKLLADVTYAAGGDYPLVLSDGRSITLDLNGHTISHDQRVIMVSHGTLNVTGTGTIQETVNDGYGAIAIKGSQNEDDTNWSTVTVGKDVTLRAWAGIFITPFASSGNPHAYGVTVNFNGTSISPAQDDHTSGGHGIYINGQIQDKTNCPVINIGSTAVVNGRLGGGIYAAGYAVWNIANGASITGDGYGIGIKAGQLNINGGTISCTGENTAPTTGYSNGINASGAAIQIESNDGYAGDIDISITGGTISSTNGCSIYEYLDSGNADTEVIDFDISGGLFKGGITISSQLVAAEGKPVITGGYFISDPAAYVPTGRIIDNGTYTLSGVDYSWNVHAPYIPAPTSAISVPVTGEGTVEVAAEVKGGTAAVEITDKAIESVLTEGAANITVDVSSIEDVEAVTIPETVATAVTGAGVSLTVATETATVELDSATLTAASKAADEGDLKVVVLPVETNELSAEQQETVGKGAIVLDLQLWKGDTQIHDFSGGSVKVSIPYEGDPVEGMIVWRMTADENGKVKLVPLAVTVNAKTGCYEFTTGRFSEYVLAYFPFTDVAEGAWYYEDTAYAFTNGLITGVTATTFAPNATTSRAMLVTILWRMEGSPESAAAKFTDLKADWYRAAVGWASANGIVEGYDDGSFRPDDAITREQFATVLCRYAEFKGRDVSPAMGTAGYEDAGSVSSYASAAMTWAVSAGIIDGSGGRLDPQGGATRAQAAAMLHRYLTL